ncbi:MAG: DUF1289 domain-containing protein [Colwellia sp.]|nr:DUF1289 domain-containing protein [Colwellia sp.]
MQLEFFDVPSPCVGICQSDEKGHCLGCMRSRKERQEWKTLKNDEKQKLIKRCIQRKKRKEKQHIVKTEQREPAAINEVDVQPSLFDSPSPQKTTETNDLDFSDFEL